MRILFDHNVPHGLAEHILGHEVTQAEEYGWEELTNGKLLSAAEGAGFDLPLTGDKNLRYQQNLSQRKIALVVLGNSAWPVVRQHIGAIVAAVGAAEPGSYTEVKIQLPPKQPFIVA